MFLTVRLNSSHDRWLNSLWARVYVEPSLALLCVSISLLFPRRNQQRSERGRGPTTTATAAGWRYTGGPDEH